MAETTPFDFVLLLIVAETTQQALLGDDFSIVNSVILVLTLFLIDIGLSYVMRWSPLLSKMINGRPTFLVHNGTIDFHALDKTRTDTADIMVAARSQHGLERLDQVKHAILENDAGISIIPQNDLKQSS
ncbi:MAG: YetF domain-containing protein [Sphingomonadaceae bacterium]